MKVTPYVRASLLTALPEDVIKLAKDVKPVTEIQQTGNDFTITSKTPGKSVTNSFTIGKEAEINTMDGKKLKVKLISNRTKNVLLYRGIKDFNR